MDKQFKSAMNGLIWFPEKGYGYCDLNGRDLYDEAYFQHYVDLEGTEVCDKLNVARINLVGKYLDNADLVLDMGIGAGTFIQYRGGSTRGYDVNSAGIDWLNARKLYMDPYAESERAVPTMTFWDVLEHIPDPTELLSKIGTYAFISMPIYEGAAHVLRSKHFKKGEHCLYFTAQGLVDWMAGHGFKCLECNTCEVDCGREDIGSFVFERTD